MRMLGLTKPLAARMLPAATRLMTVSMSMATTGRNPLLADWSKSEPYGLPPFGRIQPEHFKPAFATAMDHHLQELQQIVDNPDPPTFDNTIAAFDRCGGVLGQVGGVFSNLCASNSPPALQAVQLEVAPTLAAHRSKIYTLPGLFERIALVHDSADAESLTVEQSRLVERIHLDFVRAGAKFDAASQARYAEIMGRLSTLLTQFQQNVMADESEVTIDLSEADLSGCPQSLVSAAKAAAEERGRPPDAYVITLSRSLVEPFLTFSPRRDLRERAWRLWTRRGQLHPSRDNLRLAREILLLRSEQAELHGYPSFAAYQNADSMAGTPERVNELLERVWRPACDSANGERELLQERLRREWPEAELEPWDWRYCAEQVRAERYDFDETALKPFLGLEAMQRALFDTARRLFGVRFVEVDLEARGIRLYHPDVQLYEVRRGDEGDEGDEGELLALFLHDNFARANKQSGAWMSEFCGQSLNWKAYDFLEGADGSTAIEGRTARGRRLPIVINNNNFAKSDPCLLSFDDALTLFHEMGHGLHGMLSDVTYSRLAGTAVLRDFVELPSQLLEHWLSSTDAVLRQHAVHHRTGEPIPREMLERLNEARNFNQGFETVEYTICALVDQALHALPREELRDLDLEAFETAQLERLNMPRGICMRHRPAHFQHLFASSGYAAAYYVYLWAEVLDADAFDCFIEQGDVFDPPTAARLLKWIYASGNSVEPSEAFRQFKGRDPTVESMLQKKGLLAVA